MKRLFDFIVAILALILLSPLLLIVALAICLESSGPALFRQDRVGLGGKLFSICKFRSMVASQGPDASHRTGWDDPRQTRVGRFIRNKSIDELPQLINVLKGEMSIVGPRPDLALEEKNYTPEDWQLRHSVRPGITGLAQVSGRSTLSFEQRLHYDLSYARNQSFLFDLKILMMTVGVVLKGRHASE